MNCDDLLVSMLDSLNEVGLQYKHNKRVGAVLYDGNFQIVDEVCPRVVGVSVTCPIPFPPHGAGASSHTLTKREQNV
jgi:hypothetical protein